jgi:hypothetical protein
VRANGSDKRIELEHAFSPASLKTGDFTSNVTSTAPASLDELRERLIDKRWVVLDHTMPSVRLEQASKARALFEAALGPLPPTADMTQGLLAWIAGQEGIEWLSAFCPAALLRGEASQWVRNEVGQRFNIRVVIESRWRHRGRAPRDALRYPPLQQERRASVPREHHW